MSAKVWKPNGEKCPVTNVVDGNGLVVIYDDDGFNKMALDQSLEGTIRNWSRGLLHVPIIPSDDGTKKPHRKTCRA